jgi:hypothetical protein
MRQHNRYSEARFANLFKVRIAENFDLYVKGKTKGAAGGGAGFLSQSEAQRGSALRLDFTVSGRVLLTLLTPHPVFHVSATIGRLMSNRRHRCPCPGGPTITCPCIFDVSNSTCIPCRFLRGANLAYPRLLESSNR